MNRYLSPKTETVAPLALGCMNFGKRTPKPEALRIIDAALDAGIGLLDTANAYVDGESERIVGEALRGRDVLVATKVGFGRVNGAPEGLRPERIRAACDESLKRLAVKVIDLYYLHVPDHSTPLEASLEGIKSLLDAGKIRHWGVSNFASWQILEMRQIAAANGMPMPAVSQQLYNAVVRQLDIEYFKYTRRFPIHTTAYNPLAGGVLAGMHKPEAPAPKGSRFDKNTLYQRRYWRSALFAAVEALREVADAENTDLVGLSYAFVMGNPGIDSVLVGPGSEAHLNAALKAREVALSEDAQRAMLQIYQDLVGTDASYAR